MPLNIKNLEVERLATELAKLTGETKTETIRQALLEREASVRRRAGDPRRNERLQDFLEREVWARVPADQLGRMPTRAEREEVLGYGVDGV